MSLHLYVILIERLQFLRIEEATYPLMLVNWELGTLIKTNFQKLKNKFQ